MMEPKVHVSAWARPTAPGLRPAGASRGEAAAVAAEPAAAARASESTPWPPGASGAPRRLASAIDAQTGEEEARSMA